MIKLFIMAILLATISTQNEVKFSAKGNSITFHANWHPNPKDLKQQIDRFNQHLQTANIQSVDLSFRYCNDRQYLLDNLFEKQWKAKQISIDFDSCSIGNEGLERILEKISEQEVEQLTLGLNSAGISELGVGKLGQKLQKLALKKLSVSLVFAKISDRGLAKLFQYSLRKEIEDISLDLVFNKLGTHSFDNFTNFIRNVDVDKLKKLTLKIGSNKLQEKGSETIFKQLQKYQRLEELHLDFYMNNLKAKGTKHLCEFVGQQKDLKHLTINLDLNYIETQGGVQIGKALKQLKHLESLQIGVASKNFGYNGFQAILNEMQGFSELKNLTIRAGVNRVGLKGAQKVSNIINKLNLEHFDLSFTQNFISDDGIEVIAEAISKKNGIKTMRLNLGFNEARGYGPISLLKSLQAKQYDEIWLGLSNNPLEDKQIKLMVPLFQTLIKKNRRFELELMSTKISQDLANQIRQIFQKAQQNGYQAIIHVDSIKEMEKIREQMEKDNNKQQPKSKQSDL